MKRIIVSSRAFVTRHLELCEMPFDPKESAKDVEKFVSSYLHMDGIFVIRMIEMHTGVIFGTDLVMSLYKSFYRFEEAVQVRPPELSPSFGLFLIF